MQTPATSEDDPQTPAHRSRCHPLSPLELSKRESCEAVIARGLGTFFEVGNALYTIKEGELYRDEFYSFESYCQDKWGICRQYAYRLIGAAEVLAQLSPIGDKLPLPTNEAQIRPLVSLPEEDRAKAWEAAVHHAGNAPVTARHVEAAAHQVVPPKTTRNGGKKGQKPVRSDFYMESALSLLHQLEKTIRRHDKDTALQLFEKLRLVLERLD